MTTFTAVLRFINLLCASIMAGGFVMVLVALIPTLRPFPPSMDFQVHRRFDIRADAYMPAVTILAMLSAVLLLITHHDMSRTSGTFLLLGLVFCIGVAIAAAGFNMPINRRIRGWSADTLPSEYPDIRERWNRIHGIRTALGMLATVCYIIAEIAR